MVLTLDIGEAIGLLGAGLSWLLGKVRPMLVFGIIATVLLMCAAFLDLDLVTVAAGEALQAAVVFFDIGELPRRSYV